MGLGCALMEGGNIISYASRKLTVNEKNYSTNDVEFVAMVFLVKFWRHYLYGVHVDVFTDGLVRTSNILA